MVAIANALEIPSNLTLVPLPPHSPELNPVEMLWLYLRERFLSLRVFEDQDPSSTPAVTHGTPSPMMPTASNLYQASLG